MSNMQMYKGNHEPKKYPNMMKIVFVAFHCSLDRIFCFIKVFGLLVGLGKSNIHAPSILLANVVGSHCVQSQCTDE